MLVQLVGKHMIIKALDPSKAWNLPSVRQTEIDYLITRSTSADAKAKMVKIDSNLNFSSSTFFQCVGDTHLEPKRNK